MIILRFFIAESRTLSWTMCEKCEAKRINRSLSLFYRHTELCLLILCWVSFTIWATCCDPLHDTETDILLGFCVLCRGILIAGMVTWCRPTFYRKNEVISWVSLLVDSLLFEVFRPKVRDALLLQDEPFWSGVPIYWKLVVAYQCLTNRLVFKLVLGFDFTQQKAIDSVFNDGTLQSKRATRLYTRPVALHHEKVYEKFSFETYITTVIIVIVLEKVYNLSIHYVFSLYMRLEFGIFFGRRPKTPCPFKDNHPHSAQTGQSTQEAGNVHKRKTVKQNQKRLPLTRQIKVNRHLLLSQRVVPGTTLLHNRTLHCNHVQKVVKRVLPISMAAVLEKPPAELPRGPPVSMAATLQLTLPPLVDEGDQYKMDAKPKGMCVIINNRDFMLPELSRRDGTDEDVGKIDEFFTRSHFKVKVLENQTDSDMLEELKRISSLDHRPYDCFVCFILSHGERESVYGTNGRLVSVSEIQSFFSARQCRSLGKKPKLFFIQACQGGEAAQGVDVEDTDHGGSWEYDVKVENPVHEHADFLTVFATAPGFIAYRNATSGTHFISTLINMMDKYPSLSLTDTVTKVTNVMDMGAGLKQIPMFKSTLRKRVVLNQQVS